MILNSRSRVRDEITEKFQDEREKLKISHQDKKVKAYADFDEKMKQIIEAIEIGDFDDNVLMSALEQEKTNVEWELQNWLADFENKCLDL